MKFQYLQQYFIHLNQSMRYSTKLQTAARHSDVNIVQRHSNNKIQLHHFYSQIPQRINFQTKLSKLEQMSFNAWYIDGKYWDACKYVSNQQEDESFKLTKIKVSNRQFIEIMEDNKEVQFDLRTTTAVVFQTKQNYLEMKETQKICFQIENQYENEKNVAYKEELRQIRNQYDHNFGLFVKWHFENAMCRICVLVKHRLDKDKMLFVYSHQSDQNILATEEKVNNEIFEKQNKVTDFMKEIIKIHATKQIFQKEILKFKEKLYESIKQDLTQKIKFFDDQERSGNNRLLDDHKLSSAFNKYDHFQSEDMIASWQEHSVNFAKNKRLYFQVLEIWIDKNKIPMQVILRLKSFGKKEEGVTHQKHYIYTKSERQFVVYKLSKQDRQKCIAFILEKGAFSKDIFIEVQVRYKDSTNYVFNGHFTYLKLQGDNSFTHQMNLYEDVRRSSVQSEKRNNKCFIYFNTKQTRHPDLETTSVLHQRGHFNNLGVIPTKYRSSVEIQYNPTTYSVIRRLLNVNVPEKITQASYSKCYLQLVSFIQNQENDSQTALAGLSPTHLTNKCPMKQRLSFYQRQLLKEIGDIDINQVQQSRLRDSRESRKQLPIDQRKLLQYLKIIDKRMYEELGRREFSINQVLHKNLLEDLKFYKPLNEVLIENNLVKFIHFTSRFKQLKQFGYELRYFSNLIPILQKFIWIVFNSKDSSDQQMVNHQKYTVHFFVFVLFIAKVYPYASSNHLKNQLYILRWLVQKKLPHYNDLLNRSHIGLENMISTHLLNLFTDLSEELTFRIWDYLISSSNVFKARIIVAFTLLTYLETTQNLALIPINKFMDKVQENAHTINVSMDFATKFSKVADIYFANDNNKTKRLQKLIKSGEKSIVEDKYLQRIIHGQSIMTEEKQQRVQAHYQANKTVQPIKELNYPLPRPNYFGKPLRQIVLFVHNLNILQNLNLIAQKYWLRITIPDSDQKGIDIFIVNKNHFYNESFKIAIGASYEFKARQEILVDIIRTTSDKNEFVELSGKLDYSSYHKDKAYKAVVVLKPRNKHNKGQTILRLSFCLKSSDFSLKLEKKDFTALENLSQKMLDYDIGENNESLLFLQDLNEQFERVKNPLDEFASESNKRIHQSALNLHDAQWLQNSKTSIQEIKTIFYHLFASEREKDLKVQFSKIYEIFAEEYKMQYVYFSEILTKLILLSDISRKKKITYLYCLAVHYQNTNSKKISSQTLNSLIRLIYKQRGIINACPYEIETSGKIIEACYYQSSLKNPENKKDFTEILQDWAYICNFKLQFNAIILGNSRELSVLRSLFDISTIQDIEMAPECRFQIVYELQGTRYMWSTVVDSKTFAIVKRGNKFLNNFDSYAEMKYLDSTQEYLLNCENVIPLQIHYDYNYAEFTEVLLKNQLVKYALQYPSLLDKKNIKNQFAKTKDVLQDSRSSRMFGNQDDEEKLDKRIIDQEKEDQFDSWVLHRGQNCIESWKRCSVVNPGVIISSVKYPNDQEIYQVNSIDLISMDEIEIEDPNQSRLSSH